MRAGSSSSPVDRDMTASSENCQRSTRVRLCLSATLVSRPNRESSGQPVSCADAASPRSRRRRPRSCRRPRTRTSADDRKLFQGPTSSAYRSAPRSACAPRSSIRKRSAGSCHLEPLRQERLVPRRAGRHGPGQRRNGRNHDADAHWKILEAMARAAALPAIPRQDGRVVRLVRRREKAAHAGDAGLRRQRLGLAETRCGVFRSARRRREGARLAEHPSSRARGSRSFPAKSSAKRSRICARCARHPRAIDGRADPRRHDGQGVKTGSLP
jgi:hypothetical protein